MRGRGLVLQLFATIKKPLSDPSLAYAKYYKTITQLFIVCSQSHTVEGKNTLPYAYRMGYRMALFLAKYAILLYFFVDFITFIYINYDSHTEQTVKVAIVAKTGFGKNRKIPYVPYVPYGRSREALRQSGLRTR